MTERELYERLFDGATGRLGLLSYEDACTIQKILISYGYVVKMSDGDIGDTYTIEWIYAGTSDNLTYANSSNVVFAHRDYLDMLYWHEYDTEEEELD